MLVRCRVVDLRGRIKPTRPRITAGDSSTSCRDGPSVNGLQDSIAPPQPFWQSRHAISISLRTCRPVASPDLAEKHERRIQGSGSAFQEAPGW
ncbi:hypothetical protein WJX72_011168 [[Myrmecia] bisecta]|uniref:Uncharacterized protein n=1 Tax=[Myrmecia] bisecta TaxID=41462 RepID=A0AAW1QSR3_9CHLO